MLLIEDDYVNQGDIQKVFHLKNSDFGPLSSWLHFVTVFLDPPYPLVTTKIMKNLKKIDPKLAEKTLGICLNKHIRKPKSHKKATEKQN